MSEKSITSNLGIKCKLYDGNRAHTANGSGTGAEHSTHHPKIEGSNPSTSDQCYIKNTAVSYDFS
jgi:hypothetical protein